LLFHIKRSDPELYKNFREHFAELAVNKLDEDFLKSQDQKEKWRFFCEKFKDTVSDYNFGTLLRIDSSLDYSKENTTLGTFLFFSSPLFFFGFCV
jgi:hypothetical protein